MKVVVKVTRKKEIQPLTKEDIQEAVCNGIIQTDVKREEIAREKIKNTKLSLWSRSCIAFFIAVALGFTVLAVVFFVEQGQELSFRISNGSKMIAVALLFVFVAVTEYATAKNKDRNFGFNAVTLLIALASLIISTIQ